MTLPPRLPSLDELQPEMDKLIANPGSVVIIAIQVLETQNYPEVGFAWFNHDDRNAIKRAVDRARAKRKGEASKAPDTLSKGDTAEHSPEQREERP